MYIFDKIKKIYLTKQALPYWVVLLLDCSIVLASCYLALYFREGALELLFYFYPTTYGMLICLLGYMVGFHVFHTYYGIIRYSSYVDMKRVTMANAIGTLLSYAAYYLVYFCSNIFPTLGRTLNLPTPRRSTLIFIIATVLMWIMRILVKSMYDQLTRTESDTRVFIYGVKSGGMALAQSIQVRTDNKYALIGFVSPDPDFDSRYIMGFKVYADDDQLISNMKAERANAIIISPLQREHFLEQESLITNLTENAIKIYMLPEATEWTETSEINAQQLREVEIEDLLPRDKIEVDMAAIGQQLSGKRILITGAAGSIGSEMVRQVAVFHPAEMILIDQAETPMHDIRLWVKKFQATQASNLSAPTSPTKFETIVTSISNAEHMECLFAAHRPDYVFHAAAYKHVPMMEDNPAIAVQNNIYGTRVIADLAVRYGTKKFVMISTDKAVNPTNVMGCSKRICEIYCQSLNKAIHEGTLTSINGKPLTITPCTQFVTTRFGNVLGSNGSVIPIFKEQIKHGGPITVTHPDIIRYFMLIPEACKLVLEAGTMGHGGEIFVFDMGKPVRIVDLAKRMIALSQAKNIEIKFTGLRDGEKLYEELLSNKENTLPTIHPKIMIAKVREYDYDEVCANEQRLLETSYTFDDMTVVRLMKQIVPEYISQESKYCELDKNRN